MHRRRRRPTTVDLFSIPRQQQHGHQETNYHRPTQLSFRIIHLSQQVTRGGVLFAFQSKPPSQAVARQTAHFEVSIHPLAKRIIDISPGQDDISDHFESTPATNPPEEVNVRSFEGARRYGCMDCFNSRCSFFLRTQFMVPVTLPRRPPPQLPTLQGRDIKNGTNFIYE